MIAGPAYSEAAEPVSTKMPAPIIAPIPNVTRFTGPSARLRLCSPVSEASFISVSSDFVANKGLPMQLLLCEGRVPETFRCQIGLRYCRGTNAFPLQKLSYTFSSAFDFCRDQSQYTGSPNSTITRLHPAVSVR